MDGVGGVAPPITIVQLNGTYEAFGMVMDFLVQHIPFATFQAKALADAVQQQLRRSNHLVALEGTKVVGYAGWILTSRSIGEAWMADRGKLSPVPTDIADAASLTIVAVTRREATLRLIRGARELNPGRRVYFKRDASSTQGVRKRTLANGIIRPQSDAQK